MGASRLKSRRRKDLGSKWARVATAILSTAPVTVEFATSSSRTWFLNATISFEFGIAVTLNAAETSTSTFETAEILNGLILIVPFV